MDIRYTHPTVAERWSPHWTYNTWLQIELAALIAQKRHGVIPVDVADGLISRVRQYHVDDDAIAEIRIFEQSTKHDVVAFLKWLRLETVNGQWLHFGLTSSDVVDTTQGLRFRDLHHVLVPQFSSLLATVSGWCLDETAMLGRTHGQVAEPTSMGVRATNWLATLKPAMASVLHHSRALQVAKLSGPVGTFAHNPVAVEQYVAIGLGLKPMGTGASQIVPRTDLALWASSVSVFAAACAKIALDTRLMNLFGEAFEGKDEGAVGSSSMAHKRNPIVAEQLRGMAQLANGYAQMLQPLDLWLERDISNSCVERVAVPDLWHVLLHITDQTNRLLHGLTLNQRTIELNLQMDANAAWISKTTLDQVRDGMDIDEARAYAVDYQVESYDLKGDATWFTRNYPRL